MNAPPVHLHYQFDGQVEHCLGFGDAAMSRTILFAPLLFDEMNRVRHMLVETMRILASLGVRTLLPDLPGCNESASEMAIQSIDSWRNAVASAAAQTAATHIASIRGGSLIDDQCNLPIWRLAPVNGASLLKTMLRVRIAAAKENGQTVTMDQLLASATAGPIELSGNKLGPQMLESLEQATPVTTNNVRVATLAELAGTPLWLRAEPQHDAAMSAAIAADLDRWSALCGR